MVTQELVLGRHAQLIADIDEVLRLVFPEGEAGDALLQDDPHAREGYLTHLQANALIYNLVQRYSRTSPVHGKEVGT